MPTTTSADGHGANPGFIYLASQSPRRRQLLEQIGVRFELLLPRADEDAEALEEEQHGELPAAYVNRVTRAKLHAARQRLHHRGVPGALAEVLNDALPEASPDASPDAPPNVPILCCDTTVALGRHILGKPRDADHAIATLTALSGKTHRVITAVAVAWGKREYMAISTSHVHFAAMPTHAIEAYVQSGEPFGKAGAYAIQSAIAAWITHIEGSYSGIMGLPLYETSQLLRRCGIIASMDGST
jgi:septum formation protein